MKDPSAALPAAGTALIVVDSPVETDRRVTAAIDDLRSKGFDIQIADVRRPEPASGVPGWCLAALRTAGSGFSILAGALVRLASLRRFWRRERIDTYELPLLTHAGHEYRMLARAIFRGHRRRAAMRDLPDLVVANDLLAGAFTRAMLGRDGRARLYYDAHEFSPFRNRDNNSVCRIVLDWAVEAWVAAGTARMGCVSPALCAASRELYGPLDTDYAPNAYYAASREPDGKFNPDLPLHIFYFGAPSNGRGLACLGAMARQDPQLRVTLFVPDHVPFHGSINWLSELENVEVFPGPDYEGRVKELSGGPVSVLSWCVIEDICLSYRMAEPSKYHQSRLFGLPVIVSEAQHLAERIREDGNGIVLPASSLSRPGEAYAAIRQGMRDHGRQISEAAQTAWKSAARSPAWRWPAAIAHRKDNPRASA